MADWDNLKLDYEQTSLQFRSLVDIRFKVLAATPTLAGLAFATVVSADKKISTGVGLLGALVTFGLILYELRNTQLYDAAMQRMRSLEGKLQFPRTRTTAADSGGVHRERPGRDYKFLGILPIVHDWALGIVYGSSFGAWIFVFTDGLVRLLELPPTWGRFHVAPFAISIIGGILIIAGFLWHDKELESLRKFESRVVRSTR
jgi:hypothetical protein